MHLVTFGLLKSIPGKCYVCLNTVISHILLVKSNYNVRKTSDFKNQYFSFLYRTNIFLALSVISGIYIVFIFEFTLPLLELLPQENFIFVTFIFLTVFFFYKVSINLHWILISVGSLPNQTLMLIYRLIINLHSTS